MNIVIMYFLILIVGLIIYNSYQEKDTCPHEWELIHKEKREIVRGYEERLVAYSYLYEYKCVHCNKEKAETDRVNLI